MEDVAHTPFMEDPEQFNREVIRVKQLILNREEV